jgi:hypothetical protein
MGKHTKEDETDGECRTHRRDEICIQILVKEAEGKRPLGRPMYRWNDNVRLK